MSRIRKFRTGYLLGVRLVLVTTDWLFRFDSELLFRVCGFFHVEVVVLDAPIEVMDRS